MRRTSDDMEAQLDVGDHVDVSELITRIAAERGALFEDTVRERRPVGVTELTARITAERDEWWYDEPTAYQPAAYAPSEDDLRDDLGDDLDEYVDEYVDDARDGVEPERLRVEELTMRLAVERGELVDDPHRHRLQMEAEKRRSRRRKIAPAIAGVATVLVATTVALTLRSGGTPAAPELNAALVGPASPSSAAPVPAPAVAAVPGLNAIAVPDPAAAAHAAPRSVAAAPPARPVIKPVPAAPVATDGTQAAVVNGWKLVDRDEFAGTTLNPKWGPYDGEGNGGKGKRSPDAITVSNGVATIHGDADGTTGGMAWQDDRRTGRWEMRARFPKGDAQYHPVLLLWPADGGSNDGEVDFAETTSAASSVSFFLHHGSGDQATARKQIDLTQWHDYAVEVTADRVTGYVDGQKWFENTDRSSLPTAAVHPVIQLDWFPKGSSPEPTDLQVDWMRIYQ